MDTLANSEDLDEMSQCSVSPGSARFASIKFCFKLSHDKQNLTLLIISYEIYETHKRSFNIFHIK